MNEMFKAVSTVLQQIMTELNGAESEEDRTVVITKFEAKWLLCFIRALRVVAFIAAFDTKLCRMPTTKIKHICHELITMTVTNDTPLLQSELAPHIDKAATV
jgi:hypothetical protein